MIRVLVRVALAVGFLLAVWNWVPIGGRTLASRYHESGGLSALLRRSIERIDPAAARPKALATRGRAVAREKDVRPVERVTEEDRRALDRRLAQELGRTGEAP